MFRLVTGLTSIVHGHVQGVHCMRATHSVEAFRSSISRDVTIVTIRNPSTSGKD